MADDQKSPLDQALDLLVFAPMGLVLTAKDELPSLVTKGRERVGNQFMVARMIGQFAVMQGQREAEKTAGRLVEQAGTLAARLGGFPGVAGPGGADAGSQEGSPVSSGATSAAAAAGAAVSANRTRQAGGAAPTTNGAAQNGSAQNGSAQNGAARNGAAQNGAAQQGPASIDAARVGAPRNESAPKGGLHDDALAIPGYDSLSASQVVQRLAGLSVPELEAVRAYEEASRSRRTILSKVSQLQADRR